MDRKRKGYSHEMPPMWIFQTYCVRDQKLAGYHDPQDENVCRVRVQLVNDGECGHGYGLSEKGGAM
jgi:hypothetical protein